MEITAISTSCFASAPTQLWILRPKIKLDPRALFVVRCGSRKVGPRAFLLLDSASLFGSEMLHGVPTVVGATTISEFQRGFQQQMLPI